MSGVELMRKAYIGIFICLFILSLFPNTSAYCQSDVPGWDKTKWGMSSDDIKKIYKAIEEIRDTGKEITYRIPDPEDKHITLIVDRNTGLREVSMYALQAQAPKIIESVKSNLNSAYGRPHNIERRKPSANIDSIYSIWSFPSTRIEFNEFWFKDQARYFTLIYKPNPAKGF